MLRRLLLGAGAAAFLAVSVPAAVVFSGWLAYKRMEPSIVDKMDQYWLSLSQIGREEYLLGDDEVFEVPYMASTLSVSAEPTRIYDAQDRLIGEFVSEKGVYASDPDQLPAYLKKALIASEDATFYEHRGINGKALARAMWVNLRNLRFSQGGSTLTQQLAKVMFTTRKKTPGRKAFEAFCARKLEQKFTKDQILLMYLNFAYFGHGAFGIEAAAQYYFGKPSSSLELPESALLVGIIPNPARYSPFENAELSAARTRTVLTRMSRLGFIPESSVPRYAAEAAERIAARQRSPEVSFWRMKVNEAPYVSEFVRRDLETRYSKERILKGGLRVRTTIDLEIQRAAQEALRAGLLRLQRELGAPKGPPLQGGLAVIRSSDGAVLALAGGTGFNFQNQLIRASDIRRPVGSAVKPFVYAAAFASGKFAPQDVIVDEPLTYKFGGRSWSPQNYDKKFRGEVTLSTAVHQSINTVSVRVLEKTGLDPVVRLLARATGAPQPRFPRNLTLALGTFDLSPLEMARGYAAFANGGFSVAPHHLRAVEDREGRALEAGGPPAPPERVLEPAVCSTMTAVLRGVLEPGGTGFGAASRAGFSVPAAAKTGTTSDYRDAWFAGYTADFSAAVWVGYDDMRVSLGNAGTGGQLAAPIWMSFVKETYKNRPSRPLLSDAAAPPAPEPSPSP
ncbi:MAG: PBP1A family penicillin-binding protein [Elusimicrobia bacterium]|nr:PBP1A family penicillin-binding protein [Elusimicrobiota bacterium]